MKWKKTRVPDNHGRPLEVWACDGYTISENINHGDHWAFEVMFKGRYIGEDRTLAGAQRVALKHYVESED